MTKDTINPPKPLFGSAPVPAPTMSQPLVAQPVQTFQPIAVQQLKAVGASSPRVLQLLEAAGSPTGILHYGDDVMATISAKSNELLDQVKDADVEFVKTQITSILKSAKSFKLDPNDRKQKGLLGGLINRVKDLVVDVKEEMLAEYNDIAAQLDRTVISVDEAQNRIIAKLTGLQEVYKANLDEYRKLEGLIADANEVKQILEKQISEEMAQVGSDQLKAEEVSRKQSVLQRLERKIANLETYKTMAIQNAPGITAMQDNAALVIEKFHDIKGITIPSWKKMIRLYIDNLEIQKASDLAADVDAANNALIKANSDQQRQTTVAVAKQANRLGVELSTIQHVHQNLLGQLADVQQINEQGAIDRTNAVVKMDEMQRLYADLAAGRKSAKDLITSEKQ